MTHQNRLPQASQFIFGENFSCVHRTRHTDGSSTFSSVALDYRFRCFDAFLSLLRPVDWISRNPGICRTRAFSTAPNIGIVTTAACAYRFLVEKVLRSAKARIYIGAAVLSNLIVGKFARAIWAHEVALPSSEQHHTPAKSTSGSNNLKSAAFQSSTPHLN